jgi:hypothetical protein
MRQFLTDIRDVLRFEFRPLTHYVYPAWQPLLWMVLIGVIGGVAGDLKAGPLTRASFSLGVFAVEAILQTVWIMLWQRYLRRKPVQTSLFPLVIILNTPQLLGGLALMVAPAAIYLPMMVLVALYSLVLSVMALAETLDESGWRIVLALLCFAPIGFLVLNMALGVAINAGWIILPTMPAAS